MAPVLRACGLRKSFRGFHPVNGVDLDVDEGAVHAENGGGFYAGEEAVAAVTVLAA